jgi:hypothetical protein
MNGNATFVGSILTLLNARSCLCYASFCEAPPAFFRAAWKVFEEMLASCKGALAMLDLLHLVCA